MLKTDVLKLAKDLSFPIDIAGQAICLFGIRGSGKTNTAGALAEELLDHHHPIAVIDPTDAWWGLRAGRDGSQSGGYQVFIFGGAHADVPLQETDGKVIAEFLVSEQVPVILSLRHLRKAAQRRFVTEFCEELYHLKGKDGNRTPLTVFIDEAPLFVPQKVMGEVARTVGAVEDLIARGRNAGFGVVLISQRSATLNADVRTQADTIICHRVTAPLDRKAISDWFEENASTEDLKGILKSLATLKNGEAWVWAPPLDIMARVQIRLRRTFDSSATPKMGETIRPPKRLTEIDIDKLKGQMAATIEKAKAEDPRELQKQVRELKAQLSRMENEKTSSLSRRHEIDPDVPKREFERGANSVKVALAKEVRVYRGQVDRLITLVHHTMKDLNINLSTAWAEVESVTIPTMPSLEGIIEQVKAEPVRPPATPPIRQQVAQQPRAARQAHAESNGNGSLTGPEQRILDAISWLEGIGNETPEQTAVSFLAGYVYGCGGYNNPRGALRGKGLVEYVPGDRIRLTDDGRKVARRPESALTTKELQDHVLARLPGPEQRLLIAMIEAYPDALTNEQCAGKANYVPNTGGYNNPRGRLRSLGLIEYPQAGMVRARDILFLGKR